MNCMKDVKSFNNKVVNDMKVFDQLHFKGKTMLGGQDQWCDQ